MSTIAEKYKYDVAVVVTSYNKLELLKRCLDGIRAQDTEYIRMIVVIADDGSTDGSAKWLSYLSWDNAHSVLWVLLNDHQGIMKTYRDAMDIAIQAKYISFCDCDDVWTDPNKTKMQFDFMEGHFSRISFTGVEIVDENGVTFPRYYPPENMSYNALLRNGYVSILTTMIRSSAYIKYANLQRFIKAGMNSWDYPIVLMMVWVNDGVDYIPNITARYTVYTESYSHSRSRLKKLNVQSGVWWVKLWFMLHKGASVKTWIYFIYRTTRDIYSIIFKRWYK